MKPHESPRIQGKSIRGDSGDSWPVWNRGITIEFQAPVIYFLNIPENRSKGHRIFRFLGLILASDLFYITFLLDSVLQDYANASVYKYISFKKMRD